MLIDRFGRVHDYLRISVTDRCDLRCAYCMPHERPSLQPRAKLLTVSEMTYLAEIFVELGIRKVRITGGEPLVRPDIESVLRRIGSIPGIQQYALSTNGTTLQAKLEAIWASGIRHLNVSLDSLQPETFRSITRSPLLPNVLDAISAAVQFQKDGECFDTVKINTVVMRDVNDHGLFDFIEFGKKLTEQSGVRGPVVEIRFIEFMPFEGNGWDLSRVVTFAEMMTRIRSRYELEPVDSIDTASSARVFTIRSSTPIPLGVGFIASMTKPFCNDCNRLRLTSDGVLRTCLFGSAELDLKQMLRAGASRSFIQDAIHRTIKAKWQSHPAPLELRAGNAQHMVSIGG